MIVRELMKGAVVSLPATATLEMATARMEEAGVRHLPVADTRGHLVGVVSLHDVARARDVERTAEGARQELRLGDIMHTDIVTAQPDLPAHQAAALLIAHKIGMLPVVDQDGGLVGVVTETDFLEIAHEVLSGVSPAQRARA